MSADGNPLNDAFGEWNFAYFTIIHLLIINAILTI
jgi:hypothetical protein